MKSVATTSSPNWPTRGPLVSVGVPVYNGGDTIGAALSSLVFQSYEDLEIIVADNHSTDNTSEVCDAIRKTDPRVKVFRHEENLGAANNFEFVLRQARGEFFMFAGDDDVWERDFVAANVANLVGDPALIASVSRVRYTRGNQEAKLAPWSPSGTSPLLGSVSQNLWRYVANPGLNSRFYSVFRRDVLVNCLPLPRFPAWDWAFIVKTLRWGKYAEVPQVLLTRSLHGDSSDACRTLGGQSTFFKRVFPMWAFSSFVLDQPHVPKSGPVLGALCSANLIGFAALMRARVMRLCRGQAR